MNYKKSTLAFAVVAITLSGVATTQITKASETRHPLEIRREITSDENTQTYTVKEGDTLGAIAHAMGADLYALAKYNNIKDVDKIYVGDKIKFAVQSTIYPGVADNSGVTANTEQHPVGDVNKDSKSEDKGEGQHSKAEEKSSQKTPPVDNPDKGKENSAKADKSSTSAKNTANTTTSSKSQASSSSVKADNNSAKTSSSAVNNTANTANTDTTPKQSVNTTKPATPNTGSGIGNLSASEEQARQWIIQHESSGNPNARNGKYIGLYQLDSSYLNGDYSVENQHRVANKYVQERYGSWAGAQNFWLNNGWY